jgi:hypothetical protein
MGDGHEVRNREVQRLFCRSLAPMSRSQAGHDREDGLYLVSKEVHIVSANTHCPESFCEFDLLLIRLETFELLSNLEVVRKYVGSRRHSPVFMRWLQAVWGYQFNILER